MADVESERRSEQVAPEAGRVWRGPAVQNVEQTVGRWKSLAHYLLHKMATDTADKTLITDFASGRNYTGAQLRDKTLAVACALMDGYNFAPGTMVCLSYDNSDYLTIVALAVLAAGGAVSCAYFRDPYAELLYLARKVEPKFLFCHAKNVGWADRLTADLGFKVVGVPMDLPAECGAGGGRTFGCFHGLFNYDYKQSPSLDKLPVATVKPLHKQVAVITMSSGTTGKPKAVAQTHLNCIADLLTMRRSYTNITFVCCASLDYVSGRLIIMGSMHAGYRVVILNGFEPRSYLEAVQRHRAQNVYLGASAFYNLITYKHLDQFDLSSVRLVFPMGAKVTYLDELRQFLAKRPNIGQVRQGFGTSEVSGVCMNAMTPEEYLRDCDNCGHLLPGIQAKIVEPKTGRSLGPNEVGIFHVRGETVFPGYYDLERARERARSEPDAGGDLDPYLQDGDVFDHEGYYVTGDLAFFDDNDQLHMIGRQKELMCCRDAKKVLPQELEVVMGAHPLVAKVCVLGIQSKRDPTLHCPRAFVVAKTERRATDDELPGNRGNNVNTNNNNNVLNNSDGKEELVHAGRHKLCNTLATERRRLIAEDIMEFVNQQVGWEKQLTGGIVLLDDIPIARDTGKMNKSFLRSLDTTVVEIYGDRSS